jgi:hypothetical protein
VVLDFVLLACLDKNLMYSWNHPFEGSIFISIFKAHGFHGNGVSVQGQYSSVNAGKGFQKLINNS